MKVETFLNSGRDRNRNRKAEWTAATIVLAILGAGLLLAGCSKKGEGWSFKNSRIANRLQAFCSEKEAQATIAEGKKLLPEYNAFFLAAGKGDWLTVSNIFSDLRRRAPQYNGEEKKDWRLVGTSWQAVVEIWGAFNLFAVGGEEFFVPVGQEIIDSIPPGSIYFGGTDSGRFLITAMVNSQIKGDPFFVLTQNALADNSYLAYLRSMYGEKIFIPSDEDLKKCCDEYWKDARDRLKKHKLKPGEEVTEVNGSLNVSGYVAVMSVNALLVKVIFDKNAGREFYLEESFPLDWMYPYLEPHGLIMKINRQPLPEIPEETVRKDRDYWHDRIAGLIGGWLAEDTTAQTVADFADRVFAHANLSGFKGDRKFIQNDYAKKMYSKLRSAIGGVYAWRAKNSKSPDEQRRMLKEAEFAYRQAWALCPYSPEAIFLYANLLADQQRKSEALIIVETAARVIPLDDISNTKAQLDNLIRALKGQP